MTQKQKLKGQKYNLETHYSNASAPISGLPGVEIYLLGACIQKWIRPGGPGQHFLTKRF